MLSVNELQVIIEREVIGQIDEWERSKFPNLYDPVVYSLRVGGKRLRPLLVLMGCQLYGDEPRKALPAALAVEVFHNFTLLHDDIMDKAEIRRNQPTVHIKFSENNAILSGDVMAFIAYRLLLESRECHLPELMALFTQTAIEICEGQQCDLDFESRLDVTTDEYLEMIRLKTAVLLGCALKTGAIIGGASPGEAAALYDAGINLGMAFQLQDDWLDTFGDEATFGKKIGGDIVSNKKTFLLTEALQRVPDNLRPELMGWLTDGNAIPEGKIRGVKQIFETLHINRLTSDRITAYSAAAAGIIESLTVANERKKPLMELCDKLIKRNS